MRAWRATRRTTSSEVMIVFAVEGFVLIDCTALWPEPSGWPLYIVACAR